MPFRRTVTPRRCTATTSTACDEAFVRLLTVEDWLQERARLPIVAVVTARENYALQRVQRRGSDGPAKYAEAGVTLVDPAAVSKL